MQTRSTRTSIRLAAAILIAGAALTASAQDIGGLIRGITSKVTGAQSSVQDVMGALRSITEVTQGKLLPGMQPPPDSQGRVVLYSTSWCGYCKRAVAHMQQRGVAFVERNIEGDKAVRAEYTSYGGKGGVPLLVLGQKTIFGFSPESFDAAYADFAPSAGTSATASPSPSPSPQKSALQAGEALTGKINAVPIYSEAGKSARVLTRLGKADEVIYMGEESNGFYRVTTPAGEGWVDKLLVRRP